MPSLPPLADVRVLSFDCYGTLIDWESGILAVLRPWADRNGVAVGDDHLLEAFSRAEPTHQRVRPALSYREVLRRTFRDVCAGFGRGATQDDAEAFAESVRDWPAFADVPDALARLKRHARLVILSNVDRDLFLEGSAPRLGVPFDAVVTAEDVGAYKPDAPHFERCFALLDEWGIARDRHVHVAESLRHDIAPANRLGIPSVWIDRRRGRTGGASRALAVEAAPDLTLFDLAALADRFDAAGQPSSSG